MSLYVRCTENFVAQQDVIKVFGHLKYLFKIITLTSCLNRRVLLQTHKKTARYLWENYKGVKFNVTEKQIKKINL